MSDEYDNFLDKVGKPREMTLEEFIELENEEAADKEWQLHWKNMPAFEQEENPAFKKIIVSFRNEEDYKEFCGEIRRLTGQIMTNKTKGIWYPKLERDENTLIRWVEKNNDNQS